LEDLERIDSEVEGEEGFEEIWRFGDLYWNEREVET
jgi:hypothetical protein